MFTPLITAGVLCILLGLVHSVMGEVLIFRRGEVVSKRFCGIIWATWHMVTLLAFGLAAVLMLTPHNVMLSMHTPIMIVAVCIAFSGALVLWATKGRHPGWAVLFIISALIFASQ